MVYKIQILLILLNPFTVGEPCDLLEHKTLDLVCAVTAADTTFKKKG